MNDHHIKLLEKNIKDLELKIEESKAILFGKFGSELVGLYTDPTRYLRRDTAGTFDIRVKELKANMKKQQDPALIEDIVDMEFTLKEIKNDLYYKKNWR